MSSTLNKRTMLLAILPRIFNIFAHVSEQNYEIIYTFINCVDSNEEDRDFIHCV